MVGKTCFDCLTKKANLLRTYLDIDYILFWTKHRIVTPCFDYHTEISLHLAEILQMIGGLRP